MDKRESYAYEKALDNAIAINKVWHDNGGRVERISNWTVILRDYGVQYIYKMAAELRRMGFFKKCLNPDSGEETMLFEVRSTPVSYKDLLPIFREIYDNNQIKPKEKMKERPRTFSIANHGVSILDEVNEIDKFTDKELVLELRKRGFDVKAEKVVKTIL